MIKFDNDWDNILNEEFEKPYYKNLQSFLDEEYKQHIIYPEIYDIFNAFKYTSYNDTKVVIIGQDPYHEEGQAHGLCFSVNKGIKIPPSLRNIYKEIQNDLGITPPSHGNLTSLATQGVLLLNTSLTVRQGMANSHKNKGWEKFTDSVIKVLNEREKPIVFLLWGGNAKQKAGLITNDRHKILTSVHPSPLSAFNGFFGCKHFSKTNQFLESIGETPIDWSIPE